MLILIIYHFNYKKMRKLNIFEHDKLDIDNLFLIIHKSNLEKYYNKYKCKNTNDLIDMLWLNYGISVKIV